jgi:hypothetical protein
MLRGLRGHEGPSVEGMGKAESGLDWMFHRGYMWRCGGWGEGKWWPDTAYLLAVRRAYGTSSGYNTVEKGGERNRIGKV